MSNNTLVNVIVWSAFFIIMLILVPFSLKRLRENRKYKAKQEAQYQSDRLEYAHLDEKKLDALSGENLVEAVIYQCLRKEDEDDNYFQHLSEAEKTIYAIYQVNQTVSSNAGLRSFFISPASEPFLKDLVTYYKNIGAFDVAEVVRNAGILNKIMETDDDSLEKDMSPEYVTYNFSDLTHEYVTLVVGTNFTTKMAQYVEEHKEEFIERGAEDETVSR
ncbi:DMP19 family protein [Sharpea azabuensis]